MVTREKTVKYLDKFIIGSLMFMMFFSALSTAGSSIGLGFAFIGWIIKIIITREFSFYQNPLNKPIIIFLLTILVSFIGSYNLKNSVEELRGFLIVFILYYLIVNNVTQLKVVKKLFYMGLISICISALYGLFWQYYYLGERLDVEFMALDYAALLVVYLLFSTLYFLFGNNDFINKLKYGLLTVLTFLVLIYNESRGAWLGFVGETTTVLWIHKRKMVFTFLIIVLLIVLFLPAGIQEEIKSIINVNSNRSNLGRLALWKGSILMFKGYPVNGIGLGNFEDVYISQYKQPNTTATSHAHNNFLNFLAETGLIGLTGFLYLLYMILKFLYISYLKIEDKFSKLFILATFGSVIGTFVIQGLTETNFTKAVVGRTVWFMIGLSVVIVKFKKKETADK